MSKATNPNERVIHHLRRLGADTSKPREIEFFIYVPTEECAYTVAAEIQKEGFDVQVELSVRGDQWLCCATKTLVPLLEELNRISEHFTILAESQGGIYDGWGTGIEG